MPTTAQIVADNPAEAIRALLDELEFHKREAARFKHEMDVSTDYAKCYESALTKIATLCGWSPPTGTCYGVPENIDSIAIRLVNELVTRKNDSANFNSPTG